MKNLLLTVVFVLASCVATQADTVGLYTFASSSLNSSDTNPDSTASAVMAGSSFTSALTPNTMYGNPLPSLAVVSTLTTGADTQAGAVGASQYFSFTITPNTGVPLSLSTLSFDYANYSTDGTYPTEGFVVRSSVDNFAANTATGVTSSSTSDGAFATSTIGLGAAAFQNLTTAVEFRIYIYDGTNQSTRGAVIDNITLTNVPEPTTYAMLIAGVSFVTLLCVRRQVRV